MIETIISIFTGGGAVGLGSIFKIVAGWLDNKSRERELREHRKILATAESEKYFQSQAFGDTAGGLFARGTRRMLALIGMSTLAVGTLHCVLFSQDPFITLGSVSRGTSSTGGGVNLFFGLIEIQGRDEPLSLTLGHIALMNFIGFQMILGYYFTPGGRK